MSSDLSGRRAAPVRSVQMPADPLASQGGQAHTQHPSSVLSARYDKSRHRVELMFRGGVWMAISPKKVPGLETASTSNLEAVQIFRREMRCRGHRSM
jgi:hypothetical protein